MKVTRHTQPEQGSRLITIAAQGWKERRDLHRNLEGPEWITMPAIPVRDLHLPKKCHHGKNPIDEQGQNETKTMENQDEEKQKKVGNMAIGCGE
jgi:hypothetical protein